MAALSITASQVKYINGPVEAAARTGEAITEGMYVTKSSTDGKWYKADCDAASADKAGKTKGGIAVSGAAGADCLITVALPGAIVTLGAGAAPAAGTAYYISDANGGLALLADLAATDYATIGAQGVGSNQVQVLNTYNAGALVPA